MKKTSTITAMIESPKGSNQKFDYDPEERRFRLSKFLRRDWFSLLISA